MDIHAHHKVPVAVFQGVTDNVAENPADSSRVKKPPDSLFREGDIRCNALLLKASIEGKQAFF